MTAVSSAGKSQIKYVFAEEDEIGIDRDGIKRLVAIAEEIKAQGAHPFFVMDSYPRPARGLQHRDRGERQPVRQPTAPAKKALGKTGSTVVLLTTAIRPAPSRRSPNPRRRPHRIQQRPRSDHHAQMAR